MEQPTDISVSRKKVITTITNLGYLDRVAGKKQPRSHRQLVPAIVFLVSIQEDILFTDSNKLK